MLDSGRRSISRSNNMDINADNWGMDEIFAKSSSGRSRASSRVDDEEELQLAALEKLPTYTRLRTGILRSTIEDGNNVDHHGRKKKYECKEVDVRKLSINDRQEFIGRVFKVAEEDNGRFLKKLRNRIDKYYYYSQLFSFLFLFEL